MWYGSPMSNYIEQADAFMASIGVEAYRVGGSVRDEFLGRRIKDADYMVRTVELKPLGELLREHAPGKVTPLKLRDGRQAGWRVGRLEIVLPRTERSTGPGHRDFQIIIDSELPLEEDAVRRDFTFNALYRDIHTGEVHDPTGRGLYDLEHRLVNTTHPDSFRDDPLRTLRALRFVSTLGYDLSSNALAEMKLWGKHVDGLTSNGYASGTILQEMSKLLLGRDVSKALRLARDTDVLGTVFPELEPMLGFDQGSRYHDLTTDEHTFVALQTATNVNAPLRVRWALLFHDSGKPETAWIGKDGRKHYYASENSEDHETAGERRWRSAAGRIGADRKLREDVAVLIRKHMLSTDQPKETRVRMQRVELGDDMLRDLILMRMCDVCGKGKPDHQKLINLSNREKIRAAAAAQHVPAAVGDLAVNGNDLKQLGANGPQIGEILRELLLDVAVDPSELKRSREWQLEQASRRQRTRNAAPKRRTG